MKPFRLFAYRIVCSDYVSQEWSLGTQEMIDKRLSLVSAMDGESGWRAETIELSQAEYALQFVVSEFRRSRRRPANHP